MVMADALHAFQLYEKKKVSFIMDVYEIYDIILDAALKLLHYLDAFSLCNASHNPPPRISQMLYLKSQRTSSVIFFTFEEDVFQDIGERKDALEAILVVDYHETVDSRLS